MKTGKFWQTSKLSQIKTYDYQFQKKYKPSKIFWNFFISYSSYSSYSVILFTLSETELDPHHQKLNVRVTSRAVKRLEEILVKPRN